MDHRSLGASLGVQCCAMVVQKATLRADEMPDLLTNPNEIVSGLKRVLSRTHAGVALAGAAIIEQGLERALRSRMRKLSHAERGRLFEGYGPLSTFSAKIDVVFALALIDREIYDRLNVVRKVRNKFAHSVNTLSFASPEIAALLFNLQPSSEEQADLESFYLSQLSHIGSHLESVEAAKPLPTEG